MYIAGHTAGKNVLAKKKYAYYQSLNRYTL